jgi:hypothetical protein
MHKSLTIKHFCGIEELTLENRSYPPGNFIE